MKYRTWMRLCPVVWKEGACYETVPDNDPWTNVPYVNFNRDNRQVKLNAYWCENDNSNLAVPVLREFSPTKEAPE